MGLSINHAWRFPAARINAFLAVLDASMFQNALERVKTIMKSMKRAAVARNVYKNYGVRKTSKKYRKLSRQVRFELVMQLARYVADSRTSHPLTDLECGVNVWFYGWHAYAIPYGWGYLFKNIEMPDWVERFPYWTHADPPKEMRDRTGLKRWRKRGMIWEKVAENNLNRLGLKREVVVLRHGSEADSIERFRKAVFRGVGKETHVNEALEVGE